MKLYHGSYLPVSNPDILFSRAEVDFGRGFYTTPIYEQALKWSIRFIRRGRSAIVSEYDFNIIAMQELSVLEFTKYSEDWLDLIANCRNGNDLLDYDLIIGGIANDDVFNTLQLYFKGYIAKKDAIKRLQYESPNVQYCFKNQLIIDNYLHYASSKEIYESR